MHSDDIGAKIGNRGPIGL